MLDGKWKQLMVLLTVLLMIALLPAAAFAAGEPQGAGNTYQDPVSKVIYTITGDTASATGGAVGSDVTGDITILSTLPTGQTVTSIGSRAFLVNLDITSVTIPASVIEIGDEAFSGTKNLKSVTFEESSSTAGTGTIWYAAFYESGIEGELVIPGRFGTIGLNAFFGCEKLTSIVLQSGVQYISQWAFGSCTSVESIDLPNTVLNIDSNAFYGCVKVKTIELPDSLTDLGPYAFNSCAIENIQFGKGLTKLKGSVFARNQISTLVIPSNITQIEAGAFSYNPIESITLPKTLEQLSGYAFGAADPSSLSYTSELTYLGTIAEWQQLLTASNSGGDYSWWTIHCTDGTLNPSWDPNTDSGWILPEKRIGKNVGWLCDSIVICHSGTMNLHYETDAEHNAVVTTLEENIYTLNNCIGNSWAPVENMTLTSGEWKPMGAAVEGVVGETVPIYVVGTLSIGGNTINIRRYVCDFTVPETVPGAAGINVRFEDASRPGTFLIGIDVTVDSGWICGNFYVPNGTDKIIFNEYELYDKDGVYSSGSLLVRAMANDINLGQDFKTTWSGYIEVIGEPGEQITFGFCGYRGTGNIYNEDNRFEALNVFTVTLPDELEITMNAPSSAVIGETISVSVDSNLDVNPKDIQWYFSSDSIVPTYSDDGLTATFTPTEAGDLYVSAQVTSGSQQKSESCRIIVTASKPEPTVYMDLIPPENAVVGQPISVSLQSNPALELQNIVWSFDPDTIVPEYSADGMTATFTPISAGIVNVSVSALVGGHQMTATCSFEVSQTGSSSFPDVEISGPSSLFVGETATFNAIIVPAVAPENIAWIIPEGMSEPVYSDGNTTVQFIPQTTGEFYIGVSVPNDEGERLLAAKRFRVEESPFGKLKVTISGPTTGTVGSPITLTAIPNKPIDANQTKWKIAPPVPFTTGPEPNTITFVPEKQATYTVGVTVWTSNGESAEFIPHNVHVERVSAEPSTIPPHSSDELNTVPPSVSAQKPAPTQLVVSMPSAVPSATPASSSTKPEMTPTSSSELENSPSPSIHPSGIVIGVPGGFPELVPTRPSSLQVLGTGSNRVISGLTASLDGNVPTVDSILKDFRPPQPGQQIQVVNQQGEHVDGSHPVGTGLVVQIVNEEGEVIDEATIIVAGDVLGIGELSLTQLVRMAEAYTGTNPLEGPYLKAATFGRGGAVTLTDLCREASLVKEMQNQAKN